MKTLEQCAVEAEFYDLIGSDGGDMLRPELCEPGQVYWGCSERGITSEIATCIGKACGLTVFEGIVYEQGGWKLATAHHALDNVYYAGYVPYVRIGDDPHVMTSVSEPERIEWYQSLLTEMYEERLEWLQSSQMPEKFKRLNVLGYTIHDDKLALSNLRRTASSLSLTL